MKKIFALLVFVLLAACGGMVQNENGSEYLTQLEGEPIGCTFLYKMESEVSVYDAQDARRYLENRIADQARPGNAYWIVAERTRPNKWVMFGPERAFIMTANVYDCPHPRAVRTARDGGAATVSVQETEAYLDAMPQPMPEPRPTACSDDCGYECTTVYGPCDM